MYSEQEFDKAIDALQSFGVKLRATAEIMKSEAESCTANMEGDTVATTYGEKLSGIADAVITCVDEQLNALLATLEREREYAKRIVITDEDS